MERMTAEELANLKNVAEKLIAAPYTVARRNAQSEFEYYATPSTILRLVEQAGRVEGLEAELEQARSIPVGTQITMGRVAGYDMMDALGRLVCVLPSEFEFPASQLDAPAPPEVAVEQKPVERLIAAGALRQFRHNDGSEGFVFAYDKAITDREVARCEECIGTGKCGPDDDPNEMDCEVCNGSGQVGSAIDAPDNSSQIVSDLKFALTDLLHNSSAPYSGEEDLDRDFQIRYDKVTKRCLDLLASLDVPVAAGLPAIPEGMALVPDYRGYAHLGTGQYVINHSRAGEPAELVISVATEEEKAGRAVGDSRDNAPDALLQPEAMAVRLRFSTVAGLDALENQLALVRSVHFAAAPVLPVEQPGQPQDQSNVMPRFAAPAGQHNSLPIDDALETVATWGPYGDDINESMRCAILLAGEVKSLRLSERHAVDEAVNRFLGWKLPNDFSPDCGISFDGRKDDEWNKNKTWPIGTNLLSANQARAMFEYVLSSPIAEPDTATQAAKPLTDEKILALSDATEVTFRNFKGGRESPYLEGRDTTGEVLAFARAVESHLKGE